MPKTLDRRPSYDELAALVVRQMNTIEAQRETIAWLEETVDRLTARVTELERRLGRNSGNSFLPPSSDTFVRPDKKPPVNTSKKRGRQPGAPGAGLAMVETPDQVEEHLPDACDGCGKTLSAADSVGFARRQVRAIPLVKTTTRIGTTRRWLHVACTSRLTLLGLGERSRDGVNTLGILPDFRGVLVHDSLSLYDGYPDARHQLCGSHLVRELTAAAEDHPSQRWPEQIRWALAELNKQAGKARADGLSEIPPERAKVYLKSFHHGLRVGLSLHPRVSGRKQSPARNLLERLQRRACDVLRFADFPGWVPFTNNAAERALRPVKTQVKISGCHQSETGAAAWLTIRSYLDSARKHGLSAFDAIHRAFTGNLWMPPVALDA